MTFVRTSRLNIHGLADIDEHCGPYRPKFHVIFDGLGYAISLKVLYIFFPQMFSYAPVAGGASPKSIGAGGGLDAGRHFRSATVRWGIVASAFLAVAVYGFILALPSLTAGGWGGAAPAPSSRIVFQIVENSQLQGPGGVRSPVPGAGPDHPSASFNKIADAEPVRAPAMMPIPTKAYLVINALDADATVSWRTNMTLRALQSTGLITEVELVRPVPRLHSRSSPPGPDTLNFESILSDLT